jgi:aminoglycoside 3-N-acetyltransferase I
VASADVTIVRLRADDAALMEAVLDLFESAFEDSENYGSARPSPGYLRRLLAGETFVCLAAVEGDTVVGALAGYELQKFEKERSEFYIYDLAVAETARRRGIATALIEALKPIAASRGAQVIFVQADHGDDPAIALYTKLGRREDVLHFDIETG